MSEPSKQFDLIIVGGGLIGMSLAVALANTPAVTVLLLEQHQAAPVNANKLDLRTTGLTRSSEQVFAAAGVWQTLQTHATVIERLEISELGAFGCARIDGNNHGISPIGYMMPNEKLIAALSEKVAKCKNMTVLSPAALIASRPHEERIGIASRSGWPTTCLYHWVINWC